MSFYYESDLKSKILPYILNIYGLKIIFSLISLILTELFFKFIDDR